MHFKLHFGYGVRQKLTGPPHRYLIAPASFAEEMFLPSLNCLGTSAENQFNKHKKDPGLHKEVADSPAEREHKRGV